METCWLRDPRNLLGSLSFVPDSNSSVGEQLNVLTRLLLIVVLVLYFLSFYGWKLVLITGLIIIFLLYLFGRNSRHTELVEHFGRVTPVYQTPLPVKKKVTKKVQKKNHLLEGYTRIEDARTYRLSWSRVEFPPPGEME